MSDELSSAAVVETPPAADTSAPTGEAAPPPAAEADEIDYERLERWLEKADPDRLRKHPRVGGIAGQMAESRVQRERERLSREAEERAAEAERTRLKELRKSDPYAYAELMEEREAKEEAERRAARLHDETRAEYMRRIGQAYHAVPEWQTILKDEAALQTLQKAVAGKDPDDLLAHFNAAALDLIANVKAQAKFDKELAARVASEREAIRREEAARLVQNEPVPDLHRPKRAASRFDWSKLSDEEFDKRYEEVYRR